MQHIQEPPTQASTVTLLSHAGVEYRTWTGYKNDEESPTLYNADYRLEIHRCSCLWNGEVFISFFNWG